MRTMNLFFGMSVSVSQMIVGNEQTAPVSLFGWLFKWYTQLDGFIFMTVIYFAVYAFTWIVTLWFHKREDSQINKALDDIRDEE